MDPSSFLQRKKEGLKLRSLYSVAACVVDDSIDAAAMLCPNAEVRSQGPFTISFMTQNWGLLD